MEFGLFVAFFPQLVAGPIARAHQLLPQIERARFIAHDQVIAGASLVFIGLIKKVIVGDGLANIVNPVFANDSAYGGLDLAIGVYAFAFQIYADFSGYTDIARGLAKLMGFELVLNFNLPYFSRSPAEFWSRWHISLSTWLRDYLLHPARREPARSTADVSQPARDDAPGRDLAGAAWTMVVWGPYHGCLLIAQRLLMGDRVEAPRGPSLAAALKIMGMFHLTCLGWLVFRATDVPQAARMPHRHLHRHQRIGCDR